MESLPAGVSLDTDTAFTSQQISGSDMFNEDSQVSKIFDEQPLDHFFTRYEDVSLAPCTNVGIESNSTLYHEMHKAVEGKPPQQQKATLLKATAGNKGRIAVGEANVLVPEKDNKSHGRHAKYT